MKAPRYLPVAALLLLGCVPCFKSTVLAAAHSPASAPITITLRPASPTLASCLPTAHARAVVTPGIHNDRLNLHAVGLPPFAGFDLFATASPRSPYRLSWPLGVAQADAHGSVDMQVQALLLEAYTPADTGYGVPAPAQAGHLVLFFDDAEDAAPCSADADAPTTRLRSGRVVGPAVLATLGYPSDAGPLRTAPFAPPGLGISTPSGRRGFSRTPITFTTACNDPAGWSMIRFIDFRLSRDGAAVFWARLDRPAKRMYLYDFATNGWIGGLQPGAKGTLGTSVARLILGTSQVVGTTGAVGRVLWTVKFTTQASGATYQQSVRVTDLRYQTRGWTSSGTWGVD
jgi:hypothetical protein